MGVNAQPPFVKVLVANRGEIAVRIMKACHALGIRTVAVYSEPDAGSLHVRLSDEAIALGGVTAAESYLNVQKIVKAVKECGADAVHPGYGFLSESEEFASAITAVGAEFVGPPASAMRAMSSKLSAREVAVAAGVPIIPGSVGAVTNGHEAREFAAKFGYPIAIKASFGGGGRGMRVVYEGDDIDNALESAQREALSYFGRSEVYVERYLERPRHVEVQVLADGYGAVVAVGTRDCSVQRRNQKLVEEAPATTLSPATVTAMERASIALSKAVGYRGAGTLEFLAQDDEFFFLEMNTRLQVEHPVTEAVTGVDLVAEQFRIAAGLPISITQEEVKISGHAIELRINAEDPRDGKFLPTPGPLSEVNVPTGIGLRWDGGYESNDIVSEYYDGLVGKLIVWGNDRSEAIRRAQKALRELYVGGVHTTGPAHDVILKHPEFLEDAHTTRWLENDEAIARALRELPEISTSVGVAPRGLATIRGRTYWIPSHSHSGNSATGPSSTPPAVQLQGESLIGLALSGDGRVVSPMQGTIVDLAVEVGQDVTASDIVCVLEAMKMENPIRAGRAGTVTEVAITLGQGVAPNELLVKID
ncbi:MAG TPA: biotin carboxylase N-terminal domain-containing protein [Gemmatimonadaceae bacterium]|nr:biotin carboxylase N-terminal domain-containing protein [Gemmatimonadaceae bacterium]